MPQVLFMLFTSGAINYIYGMLGIGVLVIFVCQVTRARTLCFNALSCPTMLILIVFCTLYCAIGEHSIQGVLYYFVCPLFAFMAGWVTVETGKRHPEEIIRYTIFFILLGFTIHALLNYTENIGRPRWQLTDYFTGRVASATVCGCINTLAFSGLAYYVFLEKNTVRKLGGITAGVISLLYAMLLGTRTQFLILAAVSAMFLVFYYMETYGWSGGIRLAAILAVLVGVCFILYSRNVFGIQTYIGSSNLLERFESGSDLDKADSYRTSSIFRGFELMFEHPLGGLKSSLYYHNMWLDIGRVAGLLPFLWMVLYTVVVNAHMLRMFSEKAIDPGFRYLLFCVYVGMQVNFLVEPVLEGLIHFFLEFTIINGMVEYYYYKVFLPYLRFKRAFGGADFIFCDSTGAPLNPGINS